MEEAVRGMSGQEGAGGHAFSTIWEVMDYLGIKCRDLGELGGG